MGSEPKHTVPEPVRTTIVGGQPKVRTKGSLPVHGGIERALQRAAGDPRFRARLLAERGAAAQAAGIALTATEEALLASVSEDQLEQFIRQATPAPEPRRHFLHQAAGWLAALLGGPVAVSGCKERPTPTRGIQPDIPEPKQPGPATEGIRPDEPPPATRGIQPDVPPPKGGPTSTTAMGIRADVPAPKETSDE